MLNRLIFITFVLFTICKTVAAQNFKVAYKDYKIDNHQKADSTIIKFLLPYTDSLHNSMGTVIGFSVNGMMKKQPESSLGNFMTDCMKIMAAKKFGVTVHAAFMNTGGIRSYIPKGDITIGKVYELMPFDNLIVLQEVTGAVLLQLLNKIAESGGWPVSGITMHIDKDKKATEVLINGKPLNEFELYTIANSDYIANGGGNCDFLKPIPQINKGYLLRDALIEYIKVMTEQGKPVDTKIENRIVYGN